MSQAAPLLGKTVLVPRGKNEAKYFSSLVEKYGGVPLEIPLLAFRPKQLSNEIQEMINRVHTYDWVIFTSNVTVETFLSLYNFQPTPFPQIAVIGMRTAEVLRAKGFEIHFIPDEYVAEGFVREFSSLVRKGMKVLIPKGNLARDYIGESLTKAGAYVDEIIIYETYLPEKSKKQLYEVIIHNELDILTFTSPSTVDHFMDVIEENGLRRNIDHLIISCIGPVTKDRIESYGLVVDVIPKTYTVEDMLKDVILYVNRLP
jgi:uroporphyrinogen-III synthase